MAPSGSTHIEWRKGSLPQGKLGKKRPEERRLHPRHHNHQPVQDHGPWRRSRIEGRGRNVGGDVSKLPVVLEIKLQKVKQSFLRVGMCLGRNLGDKGLKTRAMMVEPNPLVSLSGALEPPPAVCSCGPGGLTPRRDGRGCPGADGFAACGWTHGRA